MKPLTAFLSCISFIVCSLVQAQQITLSTTSYKYQLTHQVCKQLASAFGEQRLPKLTLIVSSQGQRIAQFVSKPEPELFLDEKLYDICRQFGTDSLSALAIVLGHELAHYYGKHSDWFGFAQLLKQQQPTIQQSEHTQVLEAQADLQGTFRAFLAGYDVFKVVKPLYKAIYMAYKLPAQMSGYPDYNHRILFVERQADAAKKLSMAYEAGLFFLLKQDYVFAQRCFTFVSEEMPIKEVLHNVGLCQLLRVCQQISLREMPFLFPVELETDNRLRLDDNRGSEFDNIDFLKQAIANFQQAVDLDATYATASINLATALILLGRTGTAKETIDQLEESLRKINKPLDLNARMVRGIALVEAGLTKPALVELHQSRGAHELAYNLKVAEYVSSVNKMDRDTLQLQHIASSFKNRLTGQKIPPKTKWGTIQLPVSQALPYADQLAIPAPGLVRIARKRVIQGDFYRILLPDSSYDLFLSIPSGNAELAKGIRSGDSVQILIDEYGEPQNLIAASESTAIFCYNTANLFVRVQNGVIKNWYIFSKL